MGKSKFPSGSFKLNSESLDSKLQKAARKRTASVLHEAALQNTVRKTCPFCNNEIIFYVGSQSATCQNCGKSFQINHK